MVAHPPMGWQAAWHGFTPGAMWHRRSAMVCRLQTMSDKALQTRIHRIRNVDKLRSFIEVLLLVGRLRLRLLRLLLMPAVNPCVSPPCACCSASSPRIGRLAQVLENTGKVDMAEEAKDALQQLLSVI